MPQNGMKYVLKKKTEQYKQGQRQRTLRNLKMSNRFLINSVKVTLFERKLEFVSNEEAVTKNNRSEM